jgi:hypothetical protein
MVNKGLGVAIVSQQGVIYNQVSGNWNQEIGNQEIGYGFRNKMLII